MDDPAWLKHAWGCIRVHNPTWIGRNSRQMIPDPYLDVTWCTLFPLFSNAYPWLIPGLSLTDPWTRPSFASELSRTGLRAVRKPCGSRDNQSGIPSLFPYSLRLWHKKWEEGWAGGGRKIQNENAPEYISSLAASFSLLFSSSSFTFTLTSLLILSSFVPSDCLTLLMWIFSFWYFFLILLSDPS